MDPVNRGRGVFTALPSAMLPPLPNFLSERRTGGLRVSGAVVVVPGSGDWWQAMLAARAGGAAAVVIADPQALPPEALAPHPWPDGVPVIVERPRLRPDVVC